MSPAAVYSFLFETILLRMMKLLKMMALLYLSYLLSFYLVLSFFSIVEDEVKIPAACGFITEVIIEAEEGEILSDSDSDLSHFSYSSQDNPRKADLMQERYYRSLDNRSHSADSEIRLQERRQRPR